jgi:hypothetical protein
MTEQEIFDTVVRHLKKQGRLAKEVLSGDCFYRAPNGDKCAVGCLISDDEYSPEMEGNSAFSLKEAGVLPTHLLPHVFFLDKLQSTHDTAKNINDCLVKLREVSFFNNLNPAVLDEVTND